MSEKKNEQAVEKSPKSFEVLELDETMLDTVSGGGRAPTPQATNYGCINNSCIKQN